MATPIITTKFDTSTSTKKFIFTDTTNWVGAGIALTSVNGNFKVISPSGVPIYNNNADINDPLLYTDALADIFNQNVSRVNRAVATPNILLPIDPVTGVAELGLYTILYNVYDSNALVFYTQTFTYDNTYVRPTVVITPYVNVLSGIVRMTDGTDYTCGGINPAPYLIGAAFRMLPPPLPDGTPRAAVTATYAIVGGQMTLRYPNVAIGDTAASIVSTITYTLIDGLIIYDIVRRGEEIEVQAADFCSIICGLKNLRLRALACCSTGVFSKDAATYYMVCSLMTEVDNQIACGVDVDMTAAIALIKSLVPCTDGCTDCGDEGSIVIPVGSILNDVVVAPGDSTVTITTVVAGTTTTYTLTVSAAVMTLIKNATTNIATLFSDITNIDTEITTINNTLAILGTNFRGQHIHTLPAAEAQLAGLNVTPSPAGQYQIFVDSQWDMETNPCIGYLRLTKNGTYIDANDVGIMNVNTNTTPISNSFNNFVSCNGTDVIGIKGIATDAFGMTGTITIKAVLLIPA